MSISYGDMAIEILRKTDDGDLLSPPDLKLLENAVNGFLNEAGDVAFCKLHADVQKGYAAPYFHGIEYLTIDHEGFIYWKGAQVEHYDMPWCYGDEGKAGAIELAERCRILEARGEKVSTVTAIWNWKEGDE